MGLFVREDPLYNEAHRMTGFNRYKQLMSFHAGNWIKANLLTTLGFIPLGTAAVISLLSSSSLVMLGGGLLGGIIFGPFLAALMKSVMSEMMDSPADFWETYRKGLKQNLKSGLLPGGLCGLLGGMFLFMAYMLMEARVAPSAGTLALYAFALFLFLFFNTLLWPQLVLFDLDPVSRIRNILLFGSKYFWKVTKAVLMELLWIGVLIIFAPITFLVIPFLGFWFIILVSQLMFYEELNSELKIEELYGITR
ncbi:MAG: hypothetical protein Q4B85_02175 [Lachnospiraceae bacterium]|nr:hypothetical protein [Lachnospiraceae bacterium]